MSIADNRTERAEAETKLSTEDIETLRRDLEYWTLRSHDHYDEYNDLSERRATVQGLHQEAVTWAALIADELRVRRDARRSQ